MYSEFFDNKGALPHHIHHRQEHAELTGFKGLLPKADCSYLLKKSLFVIDKVI